MHTPPYALPLAVEGSQTSQLMRSLSEPDCAVVFVHGFLGGAVSTWAGFEDQLSRRLPNWDFIFYGYDSLGAQVNIHACQLEDLLRRLTLKKCWREKPFEHLLIVCHSLGAVVARRALLNAWIKREDWITRVSLVLFAPAHLGATNVIKFLGSVSGAVGTTLGTAVENLVPLLKVAGPVGNIAADYVTATIAKCFQDVRVGSTTLNQLKRDTLDAAKERPNDDGFWRAKRVVFAYGEDVVDANRFCSDPVAEIVQVRSGLRSRYGTSHDHTRVCKPTMFFQAPVKAVAEVAEKISPLTDRVLKQKALPLNELYSNLVAGLRRQAHLDLNRFRNSGGKVPKSDKEKNRFNRGRDCQLELLEWLELGLVCGYAKLGPPEEKNFFLPNKKVLSYLTRYKKKRPLVKQLFLRLSTDVQNRREGDKVDNRFAYLRLVSLGVRTRRDDGLYDLLLLLRGRIKNLSGHSTIVMPREQVSLEDLRLTLNDPERARELADSSGDSRLSRAVRGFFSFLILTEDYLDILLATREPGQLLPACHTHFFRPLFVKFYDEFWKKRQFSSKYEISSLAIEDAEDRDIDVVSLLRKDWDKLAELLAEGRSCTNDAEQST